MGQENSSGSQTLCYINALGQEECFRNEYTSTNDYHMGFDLVAKTPTQRAMVLQNLLQEEEDKLKLFGNTLVTREQLHAHLPEKHCFQATLTDQWQRTSEWICRDDLEHYWRNKCIFGVCEEVEEMHKLFLGHCVDIMGTSICPSEVLPLHSITHEMLGDDHRVIGDTIIGESDIFRAFRGGRCFKVAKTFFCDDDVPHLFRTGCMQVHQHDQAGHNLFDVCGADFVKLLYGDVIQIGDHILRAHFSSDFNDLSHECIQTESQHYTCWDDVDALYNEEEECALYGNTWLCYLQVRKTWRKGDCLSIDGMDVCDHQFHLVAQRKCVTLSDGKEYCPSAYGKRTPRLEDLLPADESEVHHESFEHHH